MLAASASKSVALRGKSLRQASPAIAPAVRRSGARRSVVVEANLFSRVTRIVGSWANGVVSTAEDPEKLLDTVVEEMQNDLIKMRQAAATILAQQKQLEAKYKQAQTTADDWLRRAELAVGKGEDDLAKEALKRRKGYQENADSLKGQIDQLAAATSDVMNNTRALEAKLTEARSKKETLKARAASAKTSQQIQEMIGGLNTSSASAAFDKMEQKVLAMEAQAESTKMLVGSDTVESKFKALEGGDVEDELSALKRGMLSTSAPAALPEGRPIKDALDLELEALRKKARAD